MWLTKLKELKQQAKLSNAQIAKLTNLPERTVVRIFSGETPNPYVDTIHRIVVVLNGSLDDILTDTSAVVGNASLAALHEENERLKLEADNLRILNSVYQERITSLAAEVANLRTQIEHKDQIIALHEYYNQRNKNN